MKEEEDNQKRLREIIEKEKEKKERLDKKEKEKEKALANQPYEFKPQKEPDWMKNLGKKKQQYLLLKIK